MNRREFIVQDNFETFVGREKDIETFQVQLGNYQRDWENAILSRNENARNAYVLDVIGIGGVGKTTFLKKIKNDIEEGDNNFISVYVDTSGDSSYIDIIVELRRELGNAFRETEGESLDAQFVLFDLLYKIFFDSYKVNYPFPLWRVLAKQSGDLLKKTVQELYNETSIDLDLVEKISSSLHKKSITPILQKIDSSFKNELVKIIMRAISNGINDISENRKMREEVRLLEKNYKQAVVQGKLNSEYGRQKYLLEVFITTIRGFIQQHAVIFFIDNFRNNAENVEVYRDINWLTSKYGLIKSVPGFFVLGERDAIEYAINNGDNEQIIYTSIKLNGLLYQDTVLYFRNCCGLCNREDTLTEVEKFMLKAALADRSRGEVIDYEKREYLPIYMMLVADYYNEVKTQKELKEKNAVITVENLGRIDKLDDLWFYFEMNMSEIRRDAFYILSCINTWKEEWFQKVKERFDNYLLSAMHVLGSISSVEWIGCQELKLHDVVREKLYESPNNLIKIDVLEWLYLYFLHMQHINMDGEMNFMCEFDNEKGIVNMDDLTTYVNISYKYIVGIANIKNSRFTQEEAFVKFIEAFEKSLDLFDSPETVNEEIIQIVRYIIKEFSRIFSNNRNLKELRYRLAILYTHSSRNLASLFESKELYEEAARDCEDLSQIAERNLNNYVFKLSYKNMMKNALAYDYGAVWEYAEAAEYGTSAVQEQYQLMCEAVSYIDFTEDERVAYENILKFISPDNSNLDNFAIEEYFQNIEIFKNSNYFKTYVSKWNKENFRDLFVPYSKARGNIPWFYFRIKRNGIKEKYYSDKFDPVLFGKKTYFIRKAIYGDGEPTFRSKHNVSVYLSKERRYEEALEISEEVLREIKNFSVQKEVKSDKEIKGRLQNLISLQLISEQEIKEAYNNYKDFLHYMGLAVEVLQYNSSFRQRIAEDHREDKVQFEKDIKEAIKRGIAALTLRYITLSQNHKEIFNSLSYLASYYYYLGEIEIGKKIMKYLVDLHCRGVEMPEEKAQEFEMMLEDMNNGVWNECRRFSEQKL